MYARDQALTRPDDPCYLMARSNEVVTFGEFDARANQFAHFLRAQGLQPGAHYAIFMENNAHYPIVSAAGERAGLYYTCINSYLTPAEVAFIVQDSGSEVLVTSAGRYEIAREALTSCPDVRLQLVVHGRGDERVVDFDQAVGRFPTRPLDDESAGRPMLYSSGTTGRPKGILKPLTELPPGDTTPYMQFLMDLWQYREGMTYLSPAPLYHSAPQTALNLAIRKGGITVVMERFDAEEYLQLIALRGDPQPTRPDHVQPVAETAGRSAHALRCALARSRRTCGGTVPRAGEARHDRLVGPHPP